MLKNILLLTFSWHLTVCAHTPDPFLIDTTPEMRKEITLPQWLNDESQALQLAKTKRLPLVIAFLGDGWCPWSEKIASEMLNAPELIQQLKDRVVLLHLPMKQEAETVGAVKEKYRVSHCPQVIVYDVEGEEIGRLGYTPVPAKQYANQIIELTTHFQEIKDFLKGPVLVCEETRIKQLYHYAKDFSASLYRDKLLQLGIERTKSAFFMLEKYAHLLQQFKCNNPVVQEMRKKVVALDPQNREQTLAHLAMLEFQKLAEQLKKKKHPEKAIVPLLDYVKKFGAKDRENLWKIEMMIAQYLFSKNFPEMALTHALASHRAAPTASKQEVEELIEYFKTASR